MPSNQLPEDVREQAAYLVEATWHNPTWDGETLRPLDRMIVDAIAPLIIEWARKDALLSAADDMPAGGMASSYWDGDRIEYATYEVYPHKKGPADWLRERARFTPETTGGQ
jgi:hypothetical protein